MRLPYGFSLVAVCVVALFSSAAQAQPPSAAFCGTTIESNLTAARKALQSNDRDTRAALACLIEAVAALNAQKPEIVHGDGVHVINVPPYKGPAPGTAQ